MSLFEVNAQMTRKLSSWWLIFWKMMRRYNQRSETFYQCSPRNWPRCNNYLLNFINISKDIMLSPANNQGQKPPGLFGKAFSQSQYSPSQSMPKKNEGWALLWGKRLLHDKGNGQGTYKSRSKTIILLEIMFKKKSQASQVPVLSQSIYVLHVTVNSAFWKQQLSPQEAWLIIQEKENDEFWNC